MAPTRDWSHGPGGGVGGSFLPAVIQRKGPPQDWAALGGGNPPKRHSPTVRLQQRSFSLLRFWARG